jgi:hypothetical protein
MPEWVKYKTPTAYHSTDRDRTINPLSCEIRFVQESEAPRSRSSRVRTSWMVGVERRLGVEAEGDGI